jgi:uncharacterized protein YsxB (DUF464 family)
MITASFSRRNDNGTESITLRLTGHAGMAEKGQDIVCASASILAYTVAQSLQFMYEEGELEEKPLIRLDSGDAVITAIPKYGFYKEALHTFFVAQVGYHLLAHNYPQYVELHSFGEAESA